MIQTFLRFHPGVHTPLLQAGEALASLRPLLEYLTSKDQFSAEWYLVTGNSEEDALRFKVFDGGFDGHDAAVAVAGQDFKTGDQTLVLWNGRDSGTEGVRVTLAIEPTAPGSTLDVSIYSPYGHSRIGDYEAVAELLQIAVRQFQPPYAQVYCMHQYKPVFADRPGVGWMAYLPKIITKKQVPAAGALIPVMRDKEQQGTIVVSVTDEVFHEKKPEHVKAAHAVEIQLVEHDLLPTYQQLMQPAA